VSTPPVSPAFTLPEADLQRSDVDAGSDSVLDEGRDPAVVIIGAGPAGLTAAYQLVKAGGPTPLVLESDDVVGGISRTVRRDGWCFDIGGHRFFTKVPEVEAMWHEILADEDFLLRPRMSRIFYDGKFFDYPLRAWNALSNLGPVEAVRCVASYGWARIHPPKDTSNFEGWVAARFGWRLYRTFFKTYTEKVWGIPAASIGADWAAQRIKNLSLGKAVVRSIFKPEKATDVTSLIEEFQYPKFGPGMMWEACRRKVEAGGGEVLFKRQVDRVVHHDGRALSVETTDATGRRVAHPAEAVISSMPLGALVRAMDPPAPAEVLAAADALRHRDFLTVALVVPDAHAFPDNWIYVHSPEVRLGRVQNFGSWSPYMIKEGRTCLGLEYFVNVGDEMWDMSDDDLVKLGTEELTKIGLIPDAGEVEAGYVVRMPNAYPVYDGQYQQNLGIVRGWLEANVPNVHPVGRAGMHRYNNQDHSMVTAMLTVENIIHGADHDTWEVNVEEDYHEESSTSSTGSSTPKGTGRAAPVTAA
jgi:protoporphyrinogen oxidase